MTVPAYSDFNAALLEWYAAHGRAQLPWRNISEETDPSYAVWVSEVMLQQTQAERVAREYYSPFMARYSDVAALARSSWEELYPLWKGLGFYGRGKRMLQTAEIVVRRYDGAFPTQMSALEQLPGIGAYTARAIMAFAQGQHVAAVDTNIEQLITALYPRRNIYKTAQQMVDSCADGARWNAAMMDLGAALRAGESLTPVLERYIPPSVREKFRPVRAKKSPTSKTLSKTTGKPKRIFHLDIGTACILQEGKYLVQQRQEGKRFAGLWEFPGGKREHKEKLRDCVKREVLEELGVEVSVRPHFHEEIIPVEKFPIRIRYHRCQIQKGTARGLEGQAIRWVRPAELSTLPMTPDTENVIALLQKMRV